MSFSVATTFPSVCCVVFVVVLCVCVDRNVREDTASSSGTEQDEDLQSLNNMIDTLNVRR